jgi:hypothetical protein
MRVRPILRPFGDSANDLLNPLPPTDPAMAAALAQAEPVTEQRQVTAKYRVTKKDGDSRISFAPVQRVHQLDTGAVTELVDIDLNLDDKLRQDFGDMKVGDEKEFTLMVTVLTGYRLPEDGVASVAG